jgi:hypothetical protein
MYSFVAVIEKKALCERVLLNRYTGSPVQQHGIRECILGNRTALLIAARGLQNCLPFLNVTCPCMHNASFRTSHAQALNAGAPRPTLKRSRLSVYTIPRLP